MSESRLVGGRNQAVGILTSRRPRSTSASRRPHRLDGRQPVRRVAAGRVASTSNTSCTAP